MRIAEAFRRLLHDATARRNVCQRSTLFPSKELPVRKRVLAAGMIMVLSGAVPIIRATASSMHALAQATTWQKQTLSKLQKRSYYMERVMHQPTQLLDQAVSSRLPEAVSPRARDQILIGRWKRIYSRTSAAYRSPPFLTALTCIHRGEGAWNDTRNPRYDGGLQMDSSFQERYGDFLLRLKGRAYNWTPLEQIWTAVYAIRGPDHRGFYPWPNTSRACNLI